MFFSLIQEVHKVFRHELMIISAHAITGLSKIEGGAVRQLVGERLSVLNLPPLPSPHTDK